MESRGIRRKDGAYWPLVFGKPKICFLCRKRPKLSANYYGQRQNRKQKKNRAQKSTNYKMTNIYAHDHGLLCPEFFFRKYDKSCLEN